MKNILRKYKIIERAEQKTAISELIKIFTAAINSI